MLRRTYPVAPDEFDHYLEDLEVRLERLRSLYEQYFMGMERIEPTVARKDVDRRFWTLRREKVRNTARRFKLQMLVQRYNTLQQYWQRTCREIENGTYRRHKLRAERTIGSLSAASAEPRASSRPPEADTTPAARAQQATRSAEEDLRALLASDFDPAAEVESALDAIFGGPAPAPPPKRGAAPLPPPSLPPRPTTQPQTPLPAAAGGPRPPPVRSLRPRGTGAPLPAPSALPPPRRTAAPLAGSSLPPRPSLPARAPQSPRSQAPPRAPGPTATPPRPPAPRTPPAGTAPERSGAAKPTSPAQAGLSDARIRELHERYLASRQGSRAAPVSLDKLAQSLRATEAKLRQQHQGRRIDFEVVVKDGKPIIKPKVTR